MPVGGQTQTNSSSSSSSTEKSNYQDLVRRVTARVWELMREELRRDSERRGRRG